MDVVIPTALPPNPIVGGFAPADPIAPQRREAVEAGTCILRKCGVQVYLAKNALVLPDKTAGELNCDIDSCVDDINELLDHPGVHALIALHGGKASSRLLRYLDYAKFAAVQKPILGFSDVCSLLNAITATTGLVTFYGPNVLSKMNRTGNADLGAIRTTELPLEKSSRNSVVVSGGVAEGRLVGGNLSTFAICTAGTQFEPKFAESILFWESGTDDWRLIDRYINSLETRGVFARVGGMLIGQIGESVLPDPFGIAYFRERFRSMTMPILWMPIFGHGSVENPIWPIGGLVQLDCDQAKVVHLEPLVA